MAPLSSGIQLTEAKFFSKHHTLAENTAWLLARYNDLKVFVCLLDLLWMDITAVFCTVSSWHSCSELFPVMLQVSQTPCLYRLGDTEKMSNPRVWWQLLQSMSLTGADLSEDWSVREFSLASAALHAWKLSHRRGEKVSRAAETNCTRYPHSLLPQESRKKWWDTNKGLYAFISAKRRRKYFCWSSCCHCRHLQRGCNLYSL